METAPLHPRRLTLQTLLLCLLAGALLACSFPAMVLALLQEPTITPTPSDTATVTNTASPSPSPSATQSPLPGTLAPATVTLTPTNTPPTPQSGAIIYTPMAALGAPNLISPNSVSGKMRPYYEWAPVVNASLYTIWVWQLDKNGEKRELVVNEQHRAPDICSNSLCQIRPDVQLVDTKRYTWVVQAYGPPGYSPFSAQLTFTATKMTLTPGPSILCPLAYSGKFGGGTANAVAVANVSGILYAYVGDGNIFRIYNVTTPGSIVETGKLSLGSTINGIDVDTVNSRYVYVAAGSAGVRILDVSDPAAPAQIGAYTTANDARRIVYKNFGGTKPILFVADGANGVRVLSVSDPQNPTLLSSSDTAGTAKDLDTSGTDTSGYLYAADYTQGVRYFSYGSGFALSDKGSDNSVIKYANSIAIEDAVVPNVMLADNSVGVNRVKLNVLPIPWPTPDASRYTQIGTQFAATDIENDGSYSYAVGGTQLLIVANSAAGPANATTALLNDARDIAVLGNFAYIADGAYGLQVLNISNVIADTPPFIVGTFDTSIVAFDVAVGGGYAYVTDYNGRLVRLNLSTPNAPALDKSANLPNSCVAKGNPYAVAIDASNAYVAANEGRLKTIDITTFSGDLVCRDGIGVCNDIGFAKDIDVPGNGQIYLACNDQGLSIGPNTFSGFNTYTVPGLANGVKISGNYAFIAAFQKGLQIVNLSNPSAAPIPYPAAGDTVPGNYHNVGLYGNYAMAVADTAGLQVINLATPGAPQLQTSLDTPGNAVNITILGDAAYIADSGSGVAVVDLTDPKYPKTLCTYNTDGIARSVSISGKYVYVADDSNGLVVLQMPMTPTPQP